MGCLGYYKKVKIKKREKPFIKCPRCGNKCLKGQTKCEECDLLFSRLEFASNKKAKQQLKHFDKDYVIYTNQLPKDVNRWKLLLYSILLGLFGGQYYYTGKFIKGAIMSLGFVYLVLTTIFNPRIPENVYTLVYFPVGIYTISWILSIVFVLSNKFKVPILVDMPSEGNLLASEPAIDLKEKKQNDENVVSIQTNQNQEENSKKKEDENKANLKQKSKRKEEKK